MGDDQNSREASTAGRGEHRTDAYVSTYRPLCSDDGALDQQPQNRGKGGEAYVETLLTVVSNQSWWLAVTIIVAGVRMRSRKGRIMGYLNANIRVILGRRLLGKKEGMW